MRRGCSCNSIWRGSRKGLRAPEHRARRRPSGARSGVLPGAGAGRAEFVDEPSSRVVVAAVGAEEAFVRAGELLVAVRVQRLDLFVAFPPSALLLQPLLQVGVSREALSQDTGLRVEAGQGGAEDAV